MSDQTARTCENCDFSQLRSTPYGEKLYCCNIVTIMANNGFIPLCKWAAQDDMPCGSERMLYVPKLGASPTMTEDENV